MAHRIIYKPEGILLSSTLGDINISVDGGYVDVTLSNSARTILAERYYSFNGTVTLYDLASLIEAEMRSSAMTFSSFTLKVFSDSVTNKADSCVFRILYCDRLIINVDVPTFLSENFLTYIQIKRIPPNDTSSLYFFAQMGESLEYSIAYRSKRKDGGFFTHEFTLKNGETATAAGVVQLDIPMDLIIADAASFASAPQSSMSILTFTVRCGQRSMTFYVDPELENFSSFYFRNCFNVWEVALFPSEATAKTVVERSTAIINGTSEFYNQSATKTYEVEAGPLTSDEAEWIDQLFTSYQVLRIETDKTSPQDPYLFAPILITDSTCEVKDTDEKLNSVKFTWRYADNRPYLRLSASPGIFTSPYNPVFS